MDGLLKNVESIENEEDFSFKKLFIPLTTTKAIYWIVFIGFIVYGNMLFNGFVWDDLGYILDNPQVHILNFATIFGQSMFNYNSADYYRPIPALYFTITYLLFHNIAFFYHFLQLTLHIICTCLVFVLFTHFFKKALALFLSFFFLVHPIQVESVAYIAQTVVPMACMFGVGALLISFKSKFTNIELFFISCLLLFSLLVKETSVLFVGMVLLFRILFKPTRYLKIILGILVIIIIYFVLRFGIGHEYFPLLQTIPVAQLPIGERLLMIPAVLYYYVLTFIFPDKLSVDQLWLVQSLNFHQFYLPLFIDVIVFALIGFLGIRLRETNKSLFKIYLFFLLWFLGGLVFLLQIFPLDMTVADRWFYNPLIGLLGLLGVFFEMDIIKNFGVKKISVSILISILVIFSVRTIIRNANWTDEITLFTHDSKISDNYQLETFLGLDYIKEQKYDEALPHYQKSAAMYPNAINLFDLGAYYQAFQNPSKAKYYYLKSYALTSNQINKEKRLLLSIKMGEYYLLYDTPAKATSFISFALHEFPNSMQLWAELAIAEYKQNNMSVALSAANKAQQLDTTGNANILYQEILNKKNIDLMESGTLSPWMNQILYSNLSFN